MRRTVTFTLVVLLFFGPLLPSTAQAFIVINEFLADPAADLTGDSNNDGTRDGSDDEFIELLNFGETDIDITGWSVSDAVSTRHIFPANTILSSFERVVIFGGGSPDLPGINWQTATSGALGLNNAGDTISLYDDNLMLIDQVTYGSLAANDQSLARWPEGSGTEFVLHSSIVQAKGALFSPGEGLNNAPVQATVPEPSTLACSLLAGLTLLARRRKI